MRATRHSLVLATLLISGMTAAEPAEAASCSRLQIISSLDITLLPSGRPAVMVKIADTPKTMLLDTGAFTSSVNQRLVDDLKLKTIENGRGIQLVDGTISYTLARLPTIAIDRLQQENANYYVLPTDTVAGESELDGILGAEFLKQYDADFDFGAGRLNIFLQDHCAGEVVYWQAPAVAVVPFRLDSNNNIRFWVELDGKSINAMLDTGAATTNLDLRRARRTFDVDVNAPDVERIGDQGGAGLYLRRFKTLAFEGVTINDPPIILRPDLTVDSFTRGPSADLVLGMTTLRRMYVYVACKEHKLYITAASPQPLPPAGALPNN